MTKLPLKRYPEDKTIEFNELSDGTYQVYVDGIQRKGKYKKLPVNPEILNWTEYELVYENTQIKEAK